MCYEFGYFGARDKQKWIWKSILTCRKRCIVSQNLSDCHTCWSLLLAYMLATKLKRGLQNVTSNFWYRMIDRDVLDLEIYLQVSETQRRMAWSHRKFWQPPSHHPVRRKKQKTFVRLLSDIDILLVRCDV